MRSITQPSFPKPAWPRRVVATIAALWHHTDWFPAIVIGPAIWVALMLGLAALMVL